MRLSAMRQGRGPRASLRKDSVAVTHRLGRHFLGASLSDSFRQMKSQD